MPTRSAQTKKAQLAKNPAPKRRPGRPRKAERPVSPANLVKIGRLWLTGHSCTEIGELISVSRQAVTYHIHNTLRPMWQAGIQQTLGEELAKIQALEQTAWAQFRSNEPVETHEQLRHVLSEGGADEQLVERVTSKVRRFNQKTWLDVVQWCIEQRCKILGHYTPTKPAVRPEHEFRVAGMTAGQVNDAMIKRMVKVIRDRKKYEEGLETARLAAQGDVI